MPTTITRFGRKTLRKVSTLALDEHSGEHGRKLVASLLIAERDLHDAQRAKDIDYSRASVALTSHLMSVVRDAHAEIIDKHHLRVERAERQLVRYIVRVTNWKAGVDQHATEPKRWPCPAISVAGTAWCVLVEADDDENKYPTLARVELGKVANLDSF